MKKVLLFACVVFAAVTANAQNEVFSATKLVGKKVVNMNTATANINTYKAVAAAPALNELAGNYTEASSGDELIECSPATVSIDGDKVNMVFANESATVSGTYDAATGIINIGQQACGSITDNRGTWELEIRGIAEFGEETISTTEELSFTVDENGGIDCNQAGYIILITKFTAAAGTSYKDGQFDGQTWTWASEPRFMPCNGVQSGFMNGRATGNKWAEFNIPVSIEDLEYSVNVYNYCGLGCLSIDINEDGTVSIPMGQPMAEIGLTDETEINTYGAYLCVYGVDLDGDQIRTNTDKEYTIGTISGNTITIEEYTRICSKFDEEGAGYALNWYSDGMTITLDDGDYKITTGIKEVTSTLEERAKNSKTYNLMGQQVDRATAKGILIRDGKKYIKKF